jgi:hypothetical protein
MVFLAILLNLIAIQYARGVVRAALDEGVRRAAPAPASVTDCYEGMSDVLEDLMAGPLGEEVTTSCVVAAGQVTAFAKARFAAWVPGVPDIAFDIEVRAVKETDA